MLIHLSIHHLAVVQHLELSFKTGMTVLTGETGAGKSILIDALGLTLGERAESSIVRLGAASAEVSAIFDLNTLPQVSTWLTEHALEAEGDCVIRRIITQDGRSRAYINGKSVPLHQLRELGEQLINIHGQHQHQTLLKPDHQRLLLDEYANHTEFSLAVRREYLQWQKLRKEQIELLAHQGQNDKLALLQYQIQEIEELNLQENELQNLETEHKQLAHAEHWLSICETALASIKNESGQDAFSAIHQALAQIGSLKTQAPRLSSCHELLSNALIQLEEAITELQDFKETVSLDPERLVTIDQRLSQIHALARKHRVQPEQLLDYQQSLEKDAKKLSSIQSSLEEIAKKLQAAEKHYLISAKHLKTSRKKFAAQLEKLVTQNLPILEMQHGHFKIEFKDKPETAEHFSPLGLEEIEFLVSTNPGLPLQPLRKIASGGELSRISLAIQVITAQKMTTPTLIFDEVDVGISGKTAETVGKLLRKLAGSTQVLCVTHLPQVAAQGHQHYKVEKNQSQDTTTTHISPLDASAKTQEIARMLGGAHITKHALAHAEEMLQGAGV
jgi:DNA repair protein RecN (Recombination protein N)